MPRPTARTQVLQKRARLRFTDAQRAELTAIVGHLPDSFFVAVEDTVNHHRYRRRPPTTKQAKKAYDEIAAHASALRELLGSGADEVAGPLRVIRRASFDRALLRELRRQLDELMDAVEIARRVPDQLAVSVQHEQLLLAQRCADALTAVGVKATTTNEGGEPRSAYTWLVEWALQQANGTRGSNAVKVAIKARKRDK